MYIRTKEHTPTKKGTTMQRGPKEILNLIYRETYKEDGALGKQGFSCDGEVWDGTINGKVAKMMEVEVDNQRFYVAICDFDAEVLWHVERGGH